jgi:hypothetical protein
MRLFSEFNLLSVKNTVELCSYERVGIYRISRDGGSEVRL